MFNERKQYKRVLKKVLITEVARERNTRNGGPRFRVSFIDNDGIPSNALTRPDAMWTYGISPHYMESKYVDMTVTGQRRRTIDEITTVYSQGV